jgi:hypothetical protein
MASPQQLISKLVCVGDVVRERQVLAAPDSNRPWGARETSSRSHAAACAPKGRPIPVEERFAVTPGIPDI